MFTGIVEEVGRLRGLTVGDRSAVLEIEARSVLTDAGGRLHRSPRRLPDRDAALGGPFRADVMPETVRRTTLAGRRPGDALNLERALTLQSRLGGHLVQGTSTASAPWPG